MTQGWIKLHRKLEENWIWEDAEKLRAWVDFLFRANHKDAEIAIGNVLIKVPRGSFVCSQRKLQQHLGWGRAKLEGFLSLLKQAHMATYKSTHQYTHIYLTNYDTYQDKEQTDQHMKKHTDQHSTSAQPAHEPATNKNEKNEKNLLELAAPEKEIKDPLEERVTLAPGLTMTRKQSKALIEEFGLEACRYYKPICSDWLLANGKKKKDAAAFMRNWIRKEQAERKGFYYPKKLPEAQRVFDSPRPTLRPQPRPFNGLGAKPERSEAEKMEVRGLVSGLLEKIGGKTPH